MKPMAPFRPGKDRRSKLCWFSHLVLAGYLAAVATLPLLHHDVVCHVQSSSHCTTCLVGAADRAADHTAALLARLVPIGSFRPDPPGPRPPVLAGDRSGRSPPAGGQA